MIYIVIKFVESKDIFGGAIFNTRDDFIYYFARKLELEKDMESPVDEICKSMSERDAVLSYHQVSKEQFEKINDLQFSFSEYKKRDERED